MSGKNGVIKMCTDTGMMLAKFTLHTPIRGIEYTPDYKYVMVSGNNEIAFFDPTTLKIKARAAEIIPKSILVGKLTHKRAFFSPFSRNSKGIVTRYQTPSPAIAVKIMEKDV